MVNNEIYLVMHWDSYNNEINVEGVFSSKVKAGEYLWDSESEVWYDNACDELEVENSDKEIEDEEIENKAKKLFLIDIDKRYPYREGESGSWIVKYEIDELIKTKKNKIKEILEEKIEGLKEIALDRYLGKGFYWSSIMVDYLNRREFKKYEYYNNLLEGIKDE